MTCFMIILMRVMTKRHPNIPNTFHVLFLFLLIRFAKNAGSYRESSPWFSLHHTPRNSGVILHVARGAFWCNTWKCL